MGQRPVFAPKVPRRCRRPLPSRGCDLPQTAISSWITPTVRFANVVVNAWRVPHSAAQCRRFMAGGRRGRLGGSDYAVDAAKVQVGTKVMLVASAASAKRASRLCAHPPPPQRKARRACGRALRSCSCSCSYSYSYSSLDLRTNRPAGEVHVFLLVLVLVPPLGGVLLASSCACARMARATEVGDPPQPPLRKGGKASGRACGGWRGYLPLSR